MLRAGPSGGETAAAELFDAHYPRLAGWCRRLVDEDSAHEVAAEAFTRLWSRWGRVQDPRGYLYITATNLIRDRWRKQEREQRAVRKVVAVARTDQTSPEPDIGLRSLVQTLPDRLRAAVLLHYYADFPVRDVAFLLERKEGTVKSDLHQARALLRAALEER